MSISSSYHATSIPYRHSHQVTIPLQPHSHSFLILVTPPLTTSLTTPSTTPFLHPITPSIVSPLPNRFSHLYQLATRHGSTLIIDILSQTKTKTKLVWNLLGSKSLFAHKDQEHNQSSPLCTKRSTAYSY